MFDAHFHIIDPSYPLIENNGYMPEAFTVKCYLDAIKQYNFSGGAVVSGSFQGFDQGYLFSALKKLGERYVGVVNLSHTASDLEILNLYKNRIRAVRFNVFRGGSEAMIHIVDFAKRAFALCGMHVELYIDGAQIEKYKKILVELPKFSIDHLGLTAVGFETLLVLVTKGAHVKATGFMRTDFDVVSAMKKIYEINPHALLFGTDLPGTRASRIFDENDFLLIKNNFSPEAQENIFEKNALRFYKI